MIGMGSAGPLDCLIVGGGPAGLTAALYLARFRRNCLLVDAGSPRAAWIPESHNIPFFPGAIGGKAILARQREAALAFGATIESGTISSLERIEDGFLAVKLSEGKRTEIRARRVLLATGSEDIEPKLPNLPDAIRRGLVRYCPICDGFEATGKNVAVLGVGKSGLGEALFMARTYTDRVTLLTLGTDPNFDDHDREKIAEFAIDVVSDPFIEIGVDDDRIELMRTAGGKDMRFDLIYSALGMKVRSELALSLGAEADEDGALRVDDHNRTTVSGLYATGDVVRGLSQIVVGMGHAAIAATDIHNRCELPTEDEPTAS